MSLVVVATALPFRAAVVPFTTVLSHWSTIVILLSGSVVGAWWGAGWATRIQPQRLYKVVAVLLMGIAVVLLFGHSVRSKEPLLEGCLLIAAGVVAGRTGTQPYYPAGGARTDRR